jgi:hypothetical protein
MLLKHAKTHFEAEQIFFRRGKSQDKTTIDSAPILSNNEVTPYPVAALLLLIRHIRFDSLMDPCGP